MKKAFKTISLTGCALVIGLLFGYTVAKERIHPLPVTEWKIDRSSYSLCYDGLHKQARWVSEYLTVDNIQGKADRTKFDFQEDPLIPTIVRATKKDYAGSGFDRGHLCPAGDAAFSDDAMRETFYLSNITPQCPQLNRKYWLKLEAHVRKLVERHGAVRVFTGGLYLPHEENGRKYVKYEVIGANNVAVPTHYFKIVCNREGAPVESYIVPNEPIAVETPLKDFTNTVESIEKAAGIVFNTK